MEKHLNFKKVALAFDFFNAVLFIIDACTVQAATERAFLLDLLLRIFFCGLDTWTPARLKAIGNALHADLFLLPQHMLTNPDGGVQTDYLVRTKRATLVMKKAGTMLVARTKKKRVNPVLQTGVKSGHIAIICAADGTVCGVSCIITCCVCRWDLLSQLSNLYLQGFC